jgi:heme O synthase-like polyprenyltransferase
MEGDPTDTVNPALPSATVQVLATSTARSNISLRRSLVALFKARIVILLLFAAVDGAFLAAGGWPGSGRLAVLLITGTLAAAGASTRP